MTSDQPIIADYLKIIVELDVVNFSVAISGLGSM
jgi:hypothetical protein